MIVLSRGCAPGSVDGSLMLCRLSSCVCTWRVERCVYPGCEALKLCTWRVERHSGCVPGELSSSDHSSFVYSMHHSGCVPGDVKGFFFTVCDIALCTASCAQ